MNHSPRSWVTGLVASRPHHVQQRWQWLHCFRLTQMFPEWRRLGQCCFPQLQTPAAPKMKYKKIHTNTHAHTHTHTHTCTHTHTHTHTHTRVHIHTHTCAHTHTQHNTSTHHSNTPHNIHTEETTHPEVLVRSPDSGHHRSSASIFTESDSGVDFLGKHWWEGIPLDVDGHRSNRFPLHWVSLIPGSHSQLRKEVHTGFLFSSL